MKLASSLDRLGAETAFEVLTRANALEAQGRRIAHVGIDAPDFDTPPHVVEAANRALSDGATRYCPAPGIPALREACADYLEGCVYPDSRCCSVILVSQPAESIDAETTPSPRFRVGPGSGVSSDNPRCGRSSL